MDSHLTPSQAHKLFGDLYRKERSPEMQAKVDAIVAETPDVFIRIKRIEDLDKKEAPRARREPLSPGPIRGGEREKKAPVQEKTASDGGELERNGLFSRIFGGDLAKWGEDTGTIVTGFLGLNRRISRRVPALFRLNQEDAMSALQCFRYAATNGWEEWEPEVYNTVLAAYQFYGEFLKTPSLFKSANTPEEWINGSFKLQRFYAILLTYPNYKTILKRELPEFSRNYESTAEHVKPLESVVSRLIELESRKPTLKNSILAQYSLARNKVESWDIIERELKITPPELQSYRAPDAVKKNINARISKLKEDYTSRKRRVDEIETINSAYFKRDEKGKIKVDFLNEILTPTIAHVYSQNNPAEALIKSHKTEPPKMLHILLRDFDLNCQNLFVGSVGLEGGGGQPEDHPIFNAPQMKALTDSLAAISRDMENFIRKNSNLTYTFVNFLQDLKEGPRDALIKKFIELVERANREFAKMAGYLRIVMANHESAVKAESSQHAPDGLKRTKSVPIEELIYGRRFIPHAERVLASGNRLAGKTVKDALFEIARNFHNYLYIFRDRELTSILTSVPKLKSEMAMFKQKLLHLGVEFDD